MKAKVLKRFIDKNTKQLNEVNSVIEVNKTRFNELRNAGNYVVEVKEEPTEEVKEVVEEVANAEPTEEVKEGN